MNDDLLIKFLLKETSKEESISVQNWLNASPSNKNYFLQFEKIWTSSKNLSAQSEISEEDAWLRFKERTNIKQAATGKLKPKYNWLKIAASFILIAAGWSVYTLLSPVSYIPVATGNVVTTKVLPDGSALTLNKNSRIRYADNFKNNRSIHLEKGNVFFNVAHNKTKPFVINVDKVSVLVVGTSFNIKHLSNITEVIVETGIVKVSLGKNEINLYKGEKIIIKKNSKELIKTPNTDLLYNYYRSKEFITNNTPLWRLILVLNEEYHTNIVINDPDIKNLTINTTFKTTATPDYILDIICQTFNLKLVRNQNQILLSNNQ